jgi:hypothetical protein
MISSSPDRSDDLPLRLRRHGRRRSYPINQRVISLPYPSPSTSPRFSPGSASTRAGMTPGLPAHPSPQGVPPVPPLMSPRHNPVHQRVPYDASPTQAVPFLAPQDSPGLDSTMWAVAPVEHGRQRKMWGGSGQEGTQLVDSDALW